MISHCCANRFAVARDEVHDPGGNTSFLASLNQVVGREGRIFGGFEHYRIAADEGWNEFPRRYRHRKIPRRDQTAEANGLPHTHRKLVGHFRGSSETVEPASFTSGV